MNEENWLWRFEGLASLPEEVRTELRASARLISVPAGQVLFGPGNLPADMLLLLEGTVRVHHTSESGREIVLYRVDSGQSCVMTAACLLAHEAYSAEGVAETDVRAAAIPAAVFDRLIATAPAFRDFVFATYARRIIDLFRVIDDVAFGRIDVRLAQRLDALAQDGGDVRSTHQQLATELGTAREVVSRQLTEFQRRGWIAQGRGTITITDRPSIRSLAEG